MLGLEEQIIFVFLVFCDILCSDLAILYMP